LNLYKDRRETSREYDQWLRQFAAETPNCTYVDVGAYEPLHRDDIFAADNKHFNPEGYKIYAELFKEVLKDELALY
jgi:lysophospholipase L1-like esterase